MSRILIQCPYGQGEVVIDTEKGTVSPTPSLVYLDAFDTADYDHPEISKLVEESWEKNEFDSAEMIAQFCDDNVKVNAEGKSLWLLGGPVEVRVIFAPDPAAFCASLHEAWMVDAA